MAPFQCDNVRDSQSTGIIGKEEHIEDSQSPDIVNCTILIFNSGYLILIKISHFFFFSFAFILSCLGIKIGFGYGCRCLGVQQPIICSVSCSLDNRGQFLIKCPRGISDLIFPISIRFYNILIFIILRILTNQIFNKFILPHPAVECRKTHSAISAEMALISKKTASRVPEGRFCQLIFLLVEEIYPY